MQRCSSAVPAEMYVVFVPYFDIKIVAKHLPGRDHLVADQLSRNSADLKNIMFLSHAGLSYMPTPLLFSILQMISHKGLEWISPHFHKLLKETW